MDKVRFGRALGYGARHAARTLMSAAEAAVAPAPQSKGAVAPAPEVQRAARPAAKVAAVRGADAVRGARTAGRSVWRPFAKFSSVLWLEITGSFFALFAVSLGRGAWVLRGAAAGSAERAHCGIYGVLAALFGYFAVSSFVRARRRGKRV